MADSRSSPLEANLKRWVERVAGIPDPPTDPTDGELLKKLAAFERGSEFPRHGAVSFYDPRSGLLQSEARAEVVFSAFRARAESMELHAALSAARAQAEVVGSLNEFTQVAATWEAGVGEGILVVRERQVGALRMVLGALRTVVTRMKGGAVQAIGSEAGWRGYFGVTSAVAVIVLSALVGE